MPKTIESLSPEDTALFQAAISPHVQAVLDGAGYIPIAELAAQVSTDAGAVATNRAAIDLVAPTIIAGADSIDLAVTVGVADLAPVNAGFTGDLAAATLDQNVSSDSWLVYSVDAFVYGRLSVQYKTTNTQPVQFAIYTKSGTTYTQVSVVNYTPIASGVQTVNLRTLGLAVPKTGQFYVAFRSSSGGMGRISGSGTGSTKLSGGTGASPGFIGGTTNTILYAVKFTSTPVESALAAGQRTQDAAIAQNAKAAWDASRVTQSAQTGATTATGSEAALGTINYRMVNKQFVAGGWLDSVDLAMSGVGTPVVYVHNADKSVAASVSLGAQTAGDKVALPVNLEIPVNGWISIYVSGVGAKTVSTQWPGGVYIASSTAGPWTFSTSGTGALARFNARETAIASQNALKAYVDATAGAGSSGNLLSNTAMVFVGGWGQSNEAGNNDTTTTVRQEYGALSFDLNGTTLYALKPGTAGIGQKVFTGFGFAAHLRRRMMGDGYPSQRNTMPIVVGRTGLGGTAIADLSRGTTYYTACISQLTAAKAAADASTARFLHLGQRAFQGERDAVIGTSRATYRAALIQLAADYDTDSKAAVAGSNDRLTVCVQVTSATSYGLSLGATWDVMQATLEATRQSRLVVIACPGYVGGSWADDRHVGDDGSYIMGAYQAEALLLYGKTGARFEGLQVVDSYIGGNSIVLVYNRSGLARDTAAIAAQASDGFSVTNSGGAVQTINSVTVGDDTVTLAMAATPVAGWIVNYGKNVATGMGTYSGGAGNIRDSAGTGKATVRGWTMHNWALAQEVVLA